MASEATETWTREILRDITARPDMETTPVSSSDIDEIVIDESDNSLVVKFHSDYAWMWGFWGVKYHTNDRTMAEHLFRGIETGGGGFFWQNIRGKRMGPSYFRGWKTKGGTWASLVPYDYVGDVMVGIAADYHLTVTLLRDGVEIKGYPWIEEMRRATPEARAQMFVERIGVLARAVAERRPQLRQRVAENIRYNLEALHV